MGESVGKKHGTWRTLPGQKPMRRTKSEIRQYIEDFISGSGGRWEWDDFISITIDDPELDLIRLQCSSIPTHYPPLKKNEYCNAEGLTELTRLAESLDDE